jgi:DUF4097 and DUF4098 domain-containing protein YvlB
MVRRQGIWVVLAVLTASPIVSASVAGTPQAFRHRYAPPHNGRVAIQNLYGNVSITAWDRDEVLVEAVKHSTGRAGSEDARIIVEPSAGSLSIRTQYAGADAAHPTSVEFRITVPRGITLESVTLTNGQLSLDGLTGSVKASAVNGDIRALKLAGQVELSTINGRVEAAFDHTSASHTILLSSVNGPIQLTIPSGSGANLEAHNLSGGIATDMGRVARTGAGHRLIVKGSGPQIRVNNVNGGISIREVASYQSSVVSRRLKHITT